MFSQRNYRILSLATAFIAGCVVVVLYIPTVRQTLATKHEQIVQHFFQAANGPYKEQQPRRPAIILPKITATLASANFSNDRADWKEPGKVSHLRQNGLVQDIPDEETLKTFTAERLSSIYHSYLDNTDIICHRKLRMGRVGDGGWEICDDYAWRPIVPCIIYSFGINNDFSFDDDSGRVFGCDVYSFDPSMKQKSYKRSDRVMFYSIGIGGKSGDPKPDHRGWVLHSLSNIRQMLNHTKRVIDVIKMDVESSEWSSLKTMLAERQLDDVRQLLVEFHEGHDSTASLLKDLVILREVERAGFRRFYVSKNFHCQRNALFFPVTRTSCYEVHFVNANFQRGDADTRLFL